MKYSVFALVLGFPLSLSLVAQEASIVVPAQYTSTEGPGIRRVAGFGADVRQQIIVSSDHLKQMVGKDLVGLSFRRDRALEVAFGGGWVALSLSLSTAQRPAANPSHIMEENIGLDVTEVFSGKLLLPSSGIGRAEIAPWGASTTARLEFSKLFHYSGGDLCVELRPLLSVLVPDISVWPVDAARNSLAGSSDVVGPSCSSYPGSPSNFGPSQSFVAVTDLIIGHTAKFAMRGTPNGGALFLLGSEMRPALDLGMIGFPGCFLQVQLNSRIFVTAFTAPIVDWAPEFGGRAKVDLQIPADANLLGAEAYCQWVDMGPPIMTSNTLRITFASDMPTLGMSIVSAAYETSAVPEIGHVSIDVGHVMRFDYR